MKPLSKDELFWSECCQRALFELGISSRAWRPKPPDPKKTFGTVKNRMYGYLRLYLTYSDSGYVNSHREAGYITLTSPGDIDLFGCDAILNLVKFARRRASRYYLKSKAPLLSTEPGTHFAQLP